MPTALPAQIEAESPSNLRGSFARTTGVHPDRTDRSHRLELAQRFQTESASSPVEDSVISGSRFRADNLPVPEAQPLTFS